MDTISDSSGIRGSVESLIGGRQENQDSYGMAETRIGMLVVVCDGMGGGPGGKTASTLATRAILDYVSGAAEDSNPVSILKEAAKAANESVLAAVEADQSLKNMGTTCVVLLIKKNEGFIMHVGDSRCYQLRKGKTLFRTADHSYVGELVRRGSISEEEARTSRYSNVITRAIGAAIDIDPDVNVLNIKPGDRFALMTDGIWGTMPEKHLEDLIGYNEEPVSLVPQIAARVDSVGVQNGGGHDNLTIALVDIPNKWNEMGKEITETEKKNVKKSKVLLTVLTSVLIIAISIILWLIFFNHKSNNLPVKGKTDNQIDIIEVSNNPQQTGIQKTVKNETSIDNTCHEVIIILEAVKKYRPSYQSKASIKEIETIRTKMLIEAVEKLEKLSSISGDGKAKEIRNTAEQMRQDIPVMKKVDSKWLHSRKDSNDAIDRNITNVKSLSK